ncbi:MAG: transglutaminase domain-containing protein, partial [Phycisphaerales bacterium]|nr:transglutaminase domain-containing protein [Phycisphaerales bacterium]
GNETFGRWGNATLGSQVGFTDVVTLGTGGLISDDSTPVLDLEVRDTDGRNLGAMGQIFYLRGAILDTYKPMAGLWTSSASGDSEGIEMHPDYAHNLGAEFEGEKARLLVQTVSIRNVPETRSHLFAINKPVSIEFQQRSTLYTGSIDRFIDGGTIERSGQHGKFRYTVESDQLTAPSVAMERRVTSSFDSDVVREIASNILRAEGIDPDPATRVPADDFAACRALESHLRREFEYTLDLKRAPSGRDPVEWFLSDERRGHCEYFASAMAAMARSIGVNTRVVTGFVATEFNETSGAYVVRQSNAHAWVECEFKPNRYWQFDPTPPAEFRRIHQPDPTLLSTAFQWVEALEYAWIRRVIGFDEEARLAILGDTFGDSMRERFDSVNTNLDTGRIQLILRAGANGFLAFGTCLLLGVGAIEGVRYLRRRFRRRTWLGLDDDEEAERRRRQALFYEQFLEILDRLAPKPDWSPPLLHVEGIVEAARDPARNVARAFYTLRFGRRVLSDEELAMVRESLEHLRQVADATRATS